MEILIKQAHEAVYLTPNQTESLLDQMDIAKFVSSAFHECCSTMRVKHRDGCTPLYGVARKDYPR
jgi:hypothetical protein